MNDVGGGEGASSPLSLDGQLLSTLLTRVKAVLVFPCVQADCATSTVQSLFNLRYLRRTPEGSPSGSFSFHLSSDFGLDLSLVTLTPAAANFLSLCCFV